MSFTVKAGTANSPGPTYQPTTMSPHLSSSSVISPYQRANGSSTATSIPPPFALTSSTAEDAKKPGTDPNKYKTTICRNWEQAGSCAFRGCTFAHGVDDLRPPMRSNTSPVLTHQPSPGNTPQMYPSAGPTQPSFIGGGRIEQLMEMLMAEINRERDLVTVHTDANKTLEAMLRKEQMHHAETAARAEGFANQAAELVRHVSERNAEILRLLELCGGQLTVEQRRRAESLASWNFASMEHGDMNNTAAAAAAAYSYAQPTPQQQQYLPNSSGGWEQPAGAPNGADQLKELLQALRAQQAQNQ